MTYKLEHLDMRICDFEGGSNDQTLREFFRETEELFDLEKADVDSMNEEQLNDYVEFTNDIWLK